MNPKVLAVVNFLERHLHWTIYLQDTAELVGMSSSRLAHLFKEEMGITIAQYLKRARMEKARSLLESTSKQIKTIGFEVGYNDANHFQREFKKANGITPTQYRSRHHKRRGTARPSRQSKRIV